MQSKINIKKNNIYFCFFLYATLIIGFIFDENLNLDLSKTGMEPTFQRLKIFQKIFIKPF